MKSLLSTTGITSLRKEMDRLFDRFWDVDFPELPTTLKEWSPALDLSENPREVIVQMEVPGVDPKDIQVTLQDQLLTIHGGKKQESERKDEPHFRTERANGAFERSICLPATVDANRTNATFKHGVLTIHPTKTSKRVGTPIPVKAL